jgi:hypothetical protein
MTRTLNRLPIGSFFRLRNDEGKSIMAICSNFVGDILNKNVYDSNISNIKVSAVLKNPKKKGWVKVEWLKSTLFNPLVKVNGKEYEFLYDYVPLMKSMGLYQNTFWLKIEEIED